ACEICGLNRYPPEEERESPLKFIVLMPSLGALILLTSFPTRLSLAAEQDARMVAPPNAVSGRLPSVAPTPAREAAKTFRVLDGFRMDRLAAPLVSQGHGRGRQGRPPSENLHRFPKVQRAGRDEQFGVGPRQSHPRRRRQQRWSNPPGRQARREAAADDTK